MLGHDDSETTLVIVTLIGLAFSLPVPYTDGVCTAQVTCYKLDLWYQVLCACLHMLLSNFRPV